MRISEYRTNDDEPLPLLPLCCGSLVLFFSRYWHRVLYRDLCGPSACIMCCCWLPGGVSLLGPAQHKLCSVLLLSLQGFLRKAVWLCFCPFFFFFCLPSLGVKFLCMAGFKPGVSTHLSCLQSHVPLLTCCVQVRQFVRMS